MLLHVLGERPAAEYVRGSLDEDVKALRAENGKCRHGAPLCREV